MISIRVSNRELELIVMRAEASRLSVSDYIRRLAMDRATKTLAAIPDQFREVRLRGILDDCASDPAVWRGMSKRACMMTYAMEFGFKVDFDWTLEQVTNEVRREAQRRVQAAA